MLSIRGLSYRYHSRHEHAIKNIDIDIEKGEFVIVTGVSGCGKSTLLKCLNGIIPQEASGEMQGKVEICGLDTAESPINVLAQNVGLVFQNPDEQIFSTRVLDEVAFGLENLCFSKDKIIQRVDWALEKVGMLDYIDLSTSALSGGQKQRVALASVLALRPDVLVLDEPLSQLDPEGAIEVLGVIKKLSDEGMTIILVEHRLHEVTSWADRIIIMDKGDVVMDCPVAEVYSHLKLFKELGLRMPEKDINYDIAAIRKQPQIEQTEQTEHNHNRVVEIRDVHFSYGKKKRKMENWVLKGVNLDISSGEMVSIIGNNGSGKSTLLHHIAGLHKPKKGKVRIADTDTKRTSAFKLSGIVSILFQNPELMLTCPTVYDEIAFGPRNMRLKAQHIEDIVNDGLQSLELSELYDCHPQAISGGQRLRCATASIAAMRPDVLLLDEPTSGQDIKNVEKLMEYCQRLSREGMTVIYITHDHEIAVKYSDRVICMENGNIVDDINLKNHSLNIETHQEAI